VNHSATATAAGWLLGLGTWTSQRLYLIVGVCMSLCVCRRLNGRLTFAC